MCMNCLVHYLSIAIILRKRSPMSVGQYLAREYGDYQADLIMIEVNSVVSRHAIKSPRRKALEIKRSSICHCPVRKP